MRGESEETSRQLAALDGVVASLRQDMAVNDELSSRQLADLERHQTQLDDERQNVQLALDAAESTVSQLQATVKQGTTTCVTNRCMAMAKLCTGQFIIFIPNKIQISFTLHSRLENLKHRALMTIATVGRSADCTA